MKTTLLLFGAAAQSLSAPASRPPRSAPASRVAADAIWGFRFRRFFFAAPPNDAVPLRAIHGKHPPLIACGPTAGKGPRAVMRSLAAPLALFAPLPARRKRKPLTH